MRKKNTRTVDGGESVMVPLMYAVNGSAGWYTGAGSLTTTDTEQLTAAEFTWAQAYANITITGKDELKNNGKSAMVNFVKSKVQAAEMSLADILGTGVFSGTGTTQIEGLGMACSGLGTYGGISKDTYAWWRGQVDTTTTNISASGFQEMYGSCSYDNEHPTVALCTQAVYDDLYADFTAYQRFVDADVAKGGFTTIMVNGIPVIVDSKVPAKSMFLLNEKYLELVVHKDRNFKFDPFVKPVDQDIKVGKVYFMGALTSSNCRSHGQFTAIA